MSFEKQQQVSSLRSAIAAAVFAFLWPQDAQAAGPMTFEQRLAEIHAMAADLPVESENYLVVQLDGSKIDVQWLPSVEGDAVSVPNHVPADGLRKHMEGRVFKHEGNFFILKVHTHTILRPTDPALQRHYEFTGHISVPPSGPDIELAYVSAQEQEFAGSRFKVGVAAADRSGIWLMKPTGQELTPDQKEKARTISQHPAVSKWIELGGVQVPNVPGKLSENDVFRKREVETLSRLESAMKPDPQSPSGMSLYEEVVAAYKDAGVDIHLVSWKRFVKRNLILELMRHGVKAR